MDSAMNEEVNFCSQCGAKINSGVKFCGSCGHDLKNSSTKITLDNKITLDKPIKVEVTNVTAEKGFKAVEKGFKAIQKGVKSTGKGLKDVFKTKEKTWSELETPSQKHLEKQANTTVETEMTTTEIDTIKYVMIIGIFAFSVLLGVLVEWWFF
jgi:uncharacterized membrane protein YvbJ